MRKKASTASVRVTRANFSCSDLQFHGDNPWSLAWYGSSLCAGQGRISQQLESYPLDSVGQWDQRGRVLKLDRYLCSFVLWCRNPSGYGHWFAAISFAGAQFVS